MNGFRTTLTALFAVSITLSASAAPVDNRLLANEADGTNWAIYGRTYSANHFSPLTQVNDGNVGKLGLAWFYDLPPMANVFTEPLAVDGVLYFAGGYSVVHALDARSGKLLWRFDPEAPAVAAHKMRGGWGIRGIALWKGSVFTGTHDGRLIALDAKTGKQLWSVQTLDADAPSYITGPPWVFNDTVIIGQGGADFGPLRGYVSAYDTATGKQRWRFHIVPGDPAKGFENAAMEMAAKTWTGRWWEYGGGGNVYSAMAYDPKYNQVLLGTGNGAPTNQKIRSPGGGDNLFLCSILALDADTGTYRWHYQVNPGESWDFNSAMDIELADVVIDGKPHSVAMHAPKNGFFYVIDRKDGKLLSAENFVEVNWAERIDLQTGRPVENPRARAHDETFVMHPGPIGAHSLQAMSYSPITGLSYIPAMDVRRVYADPKGDLTQWKPGPNMIVNQGFGPPSKPVAVPPITSVLLAWDPVKQRQAWSVPLAGAFNGGTAATAGNLVFQGRVTGEFVAYAADKGTPLWSFDAQVGIESQPISYLADGKQYISVVAGWRGMGSSSGAPPDWEYRLQPRRVLSFAIDGAANLPQPGPRTTAFVDDPAFVVDPQKAAIGQAVAMSHCPLCHGIGLASGGAAPDLRKSPIPLSLDSLRAVVQGGLLVPKGMPRFEEFTTEQLEGLQHYIRQQSRAAAAATNAAH